MVIVGLPYAFQGQIGTAEVMGGSPYGATTIAGGHGSRPPSAVELEGVRFRGRRVTSIAATLAARRPWPPSDPFPARYWCVV